MLILRPTNLTIELYETQDEFSIYHWDDKTNKSNNCFDFGELITVKTIKDNLGIHVIITPTPMDILQCLKVITNKFVNTLVINHVLTIHEHCSPNLVI